MSIFVIGVNHNTAPVSIREQVAFSPERMDDALHEASGLVDENLILSTCNRTELYAVSHQEESIGALTAWLARFHQLSPEQLRPYLYIHKTDQAVQHTLRVACGLDSLVLGEPQILGQLKDALKYATQEKTTGQQLSRLMQHAFSAAKRIRTETRIGSNPVSVAFAAVSLARQIFSKLEDQTALLIGAGETIELVARHLAGQKVGRIIIANRSVEKAQKLANEFSGQGISLPEIPDYLPQADILISSTAAPLPIIGKGVTERALRQRKHRPIFMVDIAVPRDIEPEVGELDDIYLYTVDDLQSVIEENLQSRRDAAEQAESMIDTETSAFMQWLQAQQYMGVIREYRQQTDQTRQAVLDKAKSMLGGGKSAEEVLEYLAHTLSNKLSHAPTQAMNQAARNGHYQQLELARTLFNLSNDEP